MVKTISAALLCALAVILVVKADPDAINHWSDGVYFPPKTSSGSGYGYRGGEVAQPNPWAQGRGDGEGGQAPSMESLGYPNPDYDPYRESGDGGEIRQYRSYEQAPSYASKAGAPAASGGYPGEYRPQGYGVIGYPPAAEYGVTDPYGWGGYGRGLYAPILGAGGYAPGYTLGADPWGGVLPFSMTGLPFW
jgi:hypothetical protein